MMVGLSSLLSITLALTLFLLAGDVASVETGESALLDWAAAPLTDPRCKGYNSFVFSTTALPTGDVRIEHKRGASDVFFSVTLKCAAPSGLGSAHGRSRGAMHSRVEVEDLRNGTYIARVGENLGAPLVAGDRVLLSISLLHLYPNAYHRMPPTCSVMHRELRTRTMAFQVTEQQNTADQRVVPGRSVGASACRVSRGYFVGATWFVRGQATGECPALPRYRDVARVLAGRRVLFLGGWQLQQLFLSAVVQLGAQAGCGHRWDPSWVARSRKHCASQEASYHRYVYLCS
jgi:hypothetical protein